MEYACRLEAVRKAEEVYRGMACMIAAGDGEDETELVDGTRCEVYLRSTGQFAELERSFRREVSLAAF